MPNKYSDFKVFAGSSGKTFAKKMCESMNWQLGMAETLKFSDGNIFVRYLEPVREKDIYIVQPIGFTPNDDLMELLFLIDACRRSSSASITVIMPYFGYAKGDKKDEPRVSIRARVVADCLETAGVDRVIMMDLHSPQVQGFFVAPVDHLFGAPVLCEYIKWLGLDKNLVVVSPDAGFAKQARVFADHLNTNIAIGDKTRTAHDENAKILHLIGDVEGMNTLIVDDFTISCGTLADMAKTLKDRGAARVFACVSHLMITPSGIKKLENSPIEFLVGTDSVNNPYITKNDRVRTVSVAPLFAQAVKRIQAHESLSPLFEQPAPRSISDI